MTRVRHVVPGPQRHGVTRHALDLLSRAPLAEHAVHRVLPDGVDSPAQVTTALAAVPEAPLVHLHLTDHLLAPTATECADIVAEFAESRAGAVSLMLHDLPQPADGPGRHERRRAAYARMASVARGVVVGSEHERTLLLDALTAEGLTSGPIQVVPLPIDRLDPVASVAPATSPTGPRRLVVFGYLYPGKGHQQAVEALASLPADVGVLALGAVSPGHEHLVTDLQARATALGREFTATGYVPEDAVLAQLRAAAVPLAPHVHVSASGSIGSWLAAGRRPLVPAGAYVDELESRCPGALFRYGPGLPHPDLAAAAHAALADPGLTWLGGVEVGPDPTEVAARLARVLHTWSAAGSPRLLRARS
ncbi:hypothetical protein [Mobilicoccus caccae]|uniref:Glycosyltransferase involved in cell wall biosynthesis n=1 Tax=Mobilicoccus caccae TaxID=1859295 RepID=A0ABQ6IPM7_9MICO|nr:hypothetical protein [Mobilicoccus caccae]GMA39208.1 hypothetical protein GCM10025883_12530 [Mobilicoccus caccae]